MNYTNDCVEDFADEDEHDGLQERLLDLLPVVQLIVISVVLNIVDAGDQLDADDGREDDADAIQ